MSQLTVGSRTFDASILKLKPGVEGKAAQAASKDGLDNVFFKLGSDTYVATGRDVAAGVKEWQEVKLNGQVGHVSRVDTGGITGKNILVGAAVGAVGMIASGALLGGLFGAMPALWEFGLFAGVGGVLAAAATGIGKFFSDRAAQEDKLAPFGTQV